MNQRPWRRIDPGHQGFRALPPSSGCLPDTLAGRRGPGAPVREPGSPGRNVSRLERGRGEPLAPPRPAVRATFPALVSAGYALGRSLVHGAQGKA